MNRLMLQIAPSGRVDKVVSSGEAPWMEHFRKSGGQRFRDLFPQAEMGEGTIFSEETHFPRNQVATAADGEAYEIWHLPFGGDAHLVEITPHRDESRDWERGFLRNILEDSGDAIVCWDTDGYIIVWNRGAERLFGWSVQEVLGKSVHESILEEYLEEHLALEKRVREEGRIAEIPTVRRHRDGREVHVTMTRSALVNREGEMVGTSILIHDVTSHVTAERQYQHSEKLAAVGQLAAGIAHELGTPLNVISGTVEYLATEMQDNGVLSEGLTTLKRQAETCTRLLHDLMNYARRPASKLTHVDINSTIRETLRLIQRSMQRDNVNVTLKCEANLPGITGDPNQLQQVMMNLFLNAWHAMRGGGDLRVATRISSDRRFVVIEVTDNGPGIRPEHLPHIFHPFFTTKASGGGTGLGLAVCEQIVEAHRGGISVTSAQGQGAQFTVRLPVDLRATQIPKEIGGD